MSKINVRELSLLLQEYTALSEVRKWNPLQKQRAAYLQSAIAAVKAGASLAEVEQEQHNEQSRAAGLPTTQFAKQDESEKEARGWQQFVKNGERRDMGEGAPMLSQLGTYTSLGHFVPTGFFPKLFAAMKKHDVLFDEDACTVIKTSNGRPLPVPVAGDTEVVASVIGEASASSSVDINSTGHAVLGAYSYSTPRFVVSLEAFDDLESSLSAVNLFRQFASDRIARGVGADLTVGNGTGKTLGLIPSLSALGVVPITAAGSAANTGGPETGANSLGSGDFAAAFSALDDAYVSSSKACWLMNKKTLATVSSIVNKFGDQLNLVKYVDGVPYIYALPVKICPSMDSIGASKTPVVVGDLSYWATRLIVDEQAGVVVYKEAPGLIEQGNIGLRCFARADGVLLYTDTNSPSPFIPIMNHS